MRQNIVFAIALFLLAISNDANAQSKGQLEVGVKIMAEGNSGYGGTAPFIGLQLVYPKGKHGGLETGIYYRPIKTDFVTYASVNGTSQYVVSTVAQRFIHLPILYRYQSKIVNFTGGPSFDFYLGWKDRSNKSQVTVTSFNRSSTVLIGIVASLSKSIYLTEKITLEPELRFNPIISEGDPYAHTAFGFAVRYKL